MRGAAHEVAGRPVEELLFESFDAEIDLDEERALEAHWKACPECRRLRDQYARLQRRLAGPALSTGEAEGAEAILRARLATRTAARGRSSFVDLVCVLAAAVLVVVAVSTIRFPQSQDGAGSATVAMLAERGVALPQGTGSLFVRERQSTPSAVSGGVDLRFDTPAEQGMVEVRIAEPGEAHGVLARAPSISGTTRLRIEGDFPALDVGASKIYDLWLHVEYDGLVVDSPPFRVLLTADRAGTHGAVP